MGTEAICIALVLIPGPLARVIVWVTVLAQCLLNRFEFGMKMMARTKAKIPIRILLCNSTFIEYFVYRSYVVTASVFRYCCWRTNET